MPDPVYFDTSAILELLNATSKGEKVRALIQELQLTKTRIYTSILTVQEASILALSRGEKGDEIYARVNDFARIVTIDMAVSLMAAKLEADVIRTFKKNQPVKDEARHRRRWDCIHIATAQARSCSTLFAYDKDFAKRAQQVELGRLRIAQPEPMQPRLDLTPGPQLVKG